MTYGFGNYTFKKIRIHETELYLHLVSFPLIPLALYGSLTCLLLNLFLNM